MSCRRRCGYRRLRHRLTRYWGILKWPSLGEFGWPPGPFNELASLTFLNNILQPSEMPTSLFETEIRKTGFVLENSIAQALKKAGWTVISNRFYVDDQETVREIDLIAYRTMHVQHFDVFTTLVISCKKSESNAWALLSRDIDLKDPNVDWWPLHAWSNDPALRFQLGEGETSRRYYAGMLKSGIRDALGVPDVDVFAFQEMNAVSGTVQNDKAIFSAVTTLMKAQAYELAALPQRKKRPAVYQFNLISIVDADLLRLTFNGDTITTTSVNSERYLARYIIGKRETFSTIRFVRPETFVSSLPDYGRLHAENCRWFATECDAFYKDILRQPKRCNSLLDAFRRQLVPFMAGHLPETQYASDPKLFELYWDDSRNRVEILIFSVEAAKVLNADNVVKIHTARELKKFFRYEGEFTYSDDMSF